MSHSVFPVELMNEIFRSSELGVKDLANCCLLSRRYLQAAQRWLYHSLEVHCFPSDGINAGEAHHQEGDHWQYSKSSWSLLVTLKSSKTLRNRIRSLEFAATGHETDEWSQVRTSLNSAMMTFVLAAPHCEKLIMKNERNPYDTIDWSASKVNEGIENATFSELTLDVLPDDYTYFTDSLQRITLISTSEDPLADWKEPRQSIYDKPLQLVHFEIFRKSNQLLDFLRTSYNSLRTLQVPLSAFPTLPFDELPRLAHLTLLYGTDENRSKNLQLSKSLWTAFGQSSSLRKLTFSGEPTLEEVAMLFGSRSDGPGRSRLRSHQAVKNTILTCRPPSLQRLELAGPVLFDLISLILDRPEIVVPEIGLSKNPNAFELETLRSMFERSPVELIWVERKAWADQIYDSESRFSAF